MDDLTPSDRRVLAGVMRSLGRGEGVSVPSEDYDRCIEIAEKVDDE